MKFQYIKLWPFSHINQLICLKGSQITIHDKNSEEVVNHADKLNRQSIFRNNRDRSWINMHKKIPASFLEKNQTELCILENMKMHIASLMITLNCVAVQYCKLRCHREDIYYVDINVCTNWTFDKERTKQKLRN